MPNRKEQEFNELRVMKDWETYPCNLVVGTLAHELYNSEQVQEKTQS